MAEAANEFEQAARPGLQYYLLSALSCVLATLGLITNSVAVIIGAMLVAPLMGPIMGLALSSIRSRPGLYRRSLFGLASGAALAITLSALIAAVARHLPFDALATVPPEVRSRANPSLFDLGIALAGGSAGAYATARMKGVAAVIGVAIATALMPPLCAVGIGIALTDVDIARGAFLLFLTNLVAIAFSAVVVFAALGFSSRDAAWGPIHAILEAGAILALGILLSGLTLRTVDAAREEARINSSVGNAVQDVLLGAELLSLSRDTVGDVLRLRIRVQVPGTATREDVLRIQEAVADDLGRTVELTFIGVPTLVLEAVRPVASRTVQATPSAAAVRISTSTPTPSPTPTPIPTPTPTAAPTPVLIPPLVGNAGLAD